jgi:outer membrane protein
MNRFIKIILTVFLVLYCQNIFSEQKKYTLDDCIKTAKSNNYRIKELELDKQSKELQLKSVWNTVFPQLSFNLGYSDSRNYIYGPDVETFSKGYSAGFSVSQTLFKSGSNWANIKKAQNSFKISELSYIQESNNLILRIKTNYYRVLQNKNLVKMRQNDVKRKEDNLALIKLLYQVGKEKNTNLEQAEIDLETAEYNILSSQKDLKISVERLNIEIGNSPETDIDLNDELKYESYSFNEQDAIKTAFQSRPDLKQKELSVKSAELDKISARSEFLPNANLSAGYNWVGDEFFPERSGWNTRLSVSLPILGGFPLYTNLKNAKINFNSLIIDQKQLQKSITVDVHEAVSNLFLADKNVKISEKALNVARNREILSRMEYSQGNLSYLDFEDTESRLTQAEISYIQSIYQFEISKANYENTLGISGGQQ